MTTVSLCKHDDDDGAGSQKDNSETWLIRCPSGCPQGLVPYQEISSIE